ncbi:MAG: hypothetical protein LAN64_11150 [Acidobacteriia bacterium]|nr:hypothetical protein [Terriglobia bacterium]
MNNNRSGRFWYGKAARNMVRGLLVSIAALAVSGIASAQNSAYQNTYNHGPALVKFKGAIGVDPLSSVAANGTVNLNIVRGVNPGAPWTIAGLDADVRSDGHIRVEGRGLLLANGNGIGTNGSQSVHATLFCGPAAAATAHDSTLAGVALEPDGDFRIDDSLSPAPPNPCSTPVLLIRNVGGVWFAAGIPRVEEEPSHSDTE